MFATSTLEMMMVMSRRRPEVDRMALTVLLLALQPVAAKCEGCDGAIEKVAGKLCDEWRTEYVAKSMRGSKFNI